MTALTTEHALFFLGGNNSFRFHPGDHGRIVAMDCRESARAPIPINSIDSIKLEIEPMSPLFEENFRMKPKLNRREHPTRGLELRPEKDARAVSVRSHLERRSLCARRTPTPPPFSGIN